MTPISRAEQEVKASALRAVSSATRQRQLEAEMAIRYLEEYGAMVEDLTKVYEPLHDNIPKWRARPRRAPRRGKRSSSGSGGRASF